MAIVFLLVLVACELGGLVAYLVVRELAHWYQSRSRSR